MDSEIDDPRALDLCAIGLGQGGGNLAAEWHRRGHRVLLFNTARSDLKALSRHEGLNLPEKLRIHVGLGGVDGAGRDPTYGAACLDHHQDEVRAAVETQLSGADGILVCAGLGGGTGSAVGELVKILEPLELPLLSVVTLPADSESGITKVNAVKAANQLVQAPLHGRIFIDNERLVESFPDVDLLSYYPTVNARVLGPLDDLNRLNRRADLYSIRSFDGEDMRKVLLSGGVLQTHLEPLDSETALTADNLVEVASRCVNGGRHLAPGLTLGQCAYLAFVVVGPEKLLKATPIHVFDDAIAGLKEATGGGAVYEGLYVGEDDLPPMAFVLSASLALPHRVQELLGAAHAEGGALMEKIQEEIAELEVSPLEGLDLFRAPTRRRTGARPKAPKPRPLGQQLLGDLNPVSAPSPAPKKRPRDPEATEAQPVPSAKNPELVPRVGTGRIAESAEISLEATRQVDKPSDALGQPEPVPEIKLPELDHVEPMPRSMEATANVEATEQIASPDEDKAPRRRTKSKARADRAASNPSLKPRVGTGRWDDDAEVPPEATEAQVAAQPADPVTEAEGDPADSSSSSSSDGVPVRAGRRAKDGDEEDSVTEAVALSEVESHVAEAEAADNDDVGWDPDDLPFGVSQEAGAFETRANLTKPVDDDAILDEASHEDVKEVSRIPSEFDLEDHDDPTKAKGLEKPEPATISANDPFAESPSGNPTVLSDLDELLLSSIVGEAARGGGTGLQNVYEDLIDRFRQAPDRRGRERVARRLIDDSRADDVEIRALAVWAMVKLEERGFRRALAKAANDENPEISKLAMSGLERIGATAG